MKFQEMKKGVKVKFDKKTPIQVVKRVKEKVLYKSKNGNGILIDRPFDGNVYDFKGEKIKVLKLGKAKKIGGK